MSRIQWEGGYGKDCHHISHLYRGCKPVKSVTTETIQGPPPDVLMRDWRWNSQGCPSCFRASRGPELGRRHQSGLVWSETQLAGSQGQWSWTNFRRREHSATVCRDGGQREEAVWHLVVSCPQGNCLPSSLPAIGQDLALYLLYLTVTSTHQSRRWEQTMLFSELQGDWRWRLPILLHTRVPSTGPCWGTVQVTAAHRSP